MNRLILLLVSVFSFLVTGCKNRTAKVERDITIENVADFSCEATYLRNERFVLADSIRFYEDSVINRDSLNPEKVEAWNSRLAKMAKRKLVLINSSRVVADSMRVLLFELTNSMTLNEKRVFNKDLEKMKIDKGCE